MVEPLLSERMLRPIENLAHLSAFDRWFSAEDFREILFAKLARDDERVASFTGKLVKHVQGEMMRAQRACAELKWVTENPGRQHTASFHPLEDGKKRDWYRSKNAKAQGDLRDAHAFLPPAIAELITYLRCYNVQWNALPRDLFRMLMLDYVVPAWHFKVLRKYSLDHFFFGRRKVL